MSNYQPVVIFIYAVIYHFAGLKPYSWHLFNLLFHLINVVLVYLLIKRISGKSILGLMVSALFALHPLHVESITWIASTKDVVYTSFYLISLKFYLEYVKNKSKINYLLALLLFILSCLSKGMAVTLPLILLLIDYFQKRKYSLILVIEKLPFLIVSLLMSIVTVFAQTNAIGTTEATNFFQNILVASHSLLFYIIKTILPLNLSAFYPYPIKTSAIVNYEFLISLPIALILLSGIYYSKKFNKIIISGFLFFLINVLMVLQLIPVGKAIAADRYYYLSSIGLFFIIAYYFDMYGQKYTGKNVSYIIFSVLVLLLGYLSLERQNVWKDSITLWNDIIQKDPENPNNYDAYYNRGLAYELIDDRKSAIESYQYAAKLNTNDGDVFNNLGLSLYKTGKYIEALEVFNRAAQLKPDNANIFNNRGNVKSRLMDLKGALEDISKAIQINPNLADAYSNRGIVKTALNDYIGAMDDYSKTISIDPNNAIAHNNRAGVIARTGDYKSAILDWDNAIRLNPQYANAFNNRGLAKYFVNDKNGACSDWNMALSLGYTQAKPNLDSFCK